MSMIIKWTNKYSNEQGYVRVIKKSLGHFENTQDKKLARKFRTEKDAQRAVTVLEDIGESQNNNFSFEEI